MFVTSITIIVKISLKTDTTELYLLLLFFRFHSISSRISVVPGRMGVAFILLLGPNKICERFIQPAPVTAPSTRKNSRNPDLNSPGQSLYLKAKHCPKREGGKITLPAPVTAPTTRENSRNPNLNCLGQSLYLKAKHCPKREGERLVTLSAPVTTPSTRENIRNSDLNSLGQSSYLKAKRCPKQEEGNITLPAPVTAPSTREKSRNSDLNSLGQSSYLKKQNAAQSRRRGILRFQLQ